MNTLARSCARASALGRHPVPSPLHNFHPAFPSYLCGSPPSRAPILWPLMPYSQPSCPAGDHSALAMAGGKDDLFERYSVDFGKKYGEGGYGATFAAKDNRTAEALACKIIDSRKMRPDAIKKECQILEALNHKNVICVKGHGMGRDQYQHLYFIFMELAGGGELFDQVIDRGVNAMPESLARSFFLQLLDGVHYCHLAGVAHRDLKLENVLLNQAGDLKLIDFGLSHVYPRLQDGTLDRSKPLRDVCGSKSYAAPEVLAAHGYDGFAADMWSLGVCLFAMLSGFFPLDEASRNDWRYPKLVEGQKHGQSTVQTVYGWYKRTATHLSREVVHLLDHLLMVDPKRRLTMAATRDHAWVLAKQFEQATYDASAEVMGEDGPIYRGVGQLPDTFETAAFMDEDDMPVCTLSAHTEPTHARPTRHPYPA